MFGWAYTCQFDASPVDDCSHLRLRWEILLYLRFDWKALQNLGRRKFTSGVRIHRSSSPRPGAELNFEALPIHALHHPRVHHLDLSDCQPIQAH